MDSTIGFRCQDCWLLITCRLFLLRVARYALQVTQRQTEKSDMPPNLIPNSKIPIPNSNCFLLYLLYAIVFITSVSQFPISVGIQFVLSPKYDHKFLYLVDMTIDIGFANFSTICRHCRLIWHKIC
jgi:hypothetical protein